MAQENKEHKDSKITILINQKPYEVPKPVMTGLEIKQLAGGPLDYWLIMVVKSPDEVAGGDDKQIQDAENVELKSGMRFRIVNAATFGV
jgi:hypothetical protein